MTLLQIFSVDVLKPEKNSFRYYELFLSRYSLITVTAIISQSLLLPEIYDNKNKKELDLEIDNMISSLSDAAIKRRKSLKYLLLGAGIQQGETIQDKEERFFAPELFSQDAKKYHLSNREFVIKGLNSSSFMSYFFLLEDTLKNIYIDLIRPANEYLKGSEVISVCLVKILSNEEAKSLFENELKFRSKLFFDIHSLAIFWDLMNFIRNQIAHAGGAYNEKSLKSYRARVDKIADYFREKDDYLESMHMILEIFDRHEKQIKETGYLIIDNSLENIIRNLSLFIMESLYICNKRRNFFS